MLLSLFRRKKAESPVALNGSILLVTHDSKLVRALASACTPLGIGCHQVGDPADLDVPGSAPPLSVILDARNGACVPLAGPLPCASPIIILTSALSPPSIQDAALCVPCNGDLHSAAGAVASVIEDRLARRRLSSLQLALDAAQSHASECDGTIAELREHLELYGAQRSQLAEVARKTAYLGQLSKEINCLDADHIVDICVNKVSRLVDATVASVYFVNEEGTQLTLRQSNHSRKIADRLPVDSDPARLMALALEKKAILLIKDIDAFSKSLRRPIDRAYSSGYATSSCIIVPLMSDNKVIAILNLADRVGGGAFDEVRDLPLVDHVSQFIGIALRNCQLYQQVWQLAKTDALTGFINHKAFFDELNREVARVKRTSAGLSLILLDVDNFKLFNDVHGHQVGDLVIRQVAQLIKGSIRTVDTAARYGGDEFAVILSDTHVEQAEVVAERIRRAIASNQLRFNDQTFFVTISAGIAGFAPDRTPADLVSDADAALYRAKSKGRNAIAVCGAN